MSNHTTPAPLTSGRVARALGVSRRTVINLVDRGDLTPIDKADGPLGPYLFDPADVEQLAAERAR